MDRRLIAVMTVMILGLTMFTISVDGADAKSNTEIMSEYYITYGTLEWDSKYHSGYTNMLYFNDGSDNHETMLKYLEDSKTPVTMDDRRNLSGKVHIYMMTKTPDTRLYVYVEGESNLVFYGETIKEPFNNSFFVKAGDTFSITVYSVKDMYGNDCSLSVNSTDVNGTYSEEVNRSTELSLSFDYNKTVRYEFHPLCYIVNYEATGYSEPSSSATSFIAICAVMAIIGLGLLVVASIKPKWSK